MPHRRYSNDEVADAAERYRRLPRAQQIRVAGEIVATRSEELSRAYSGVARIGVGLRRRRDGGGAARIDRDGGICVLFMVERKWRTNASRDGKIPAFLLAFAARGRKGTPALVAVPTDVDPVQAIGRFRSEQRIGCWLHGHTESYGLGYCCCAVVESTAPAGRFGISCRHVLSFGDYARTSWDIVTAQGMLDANVEDIRGPATGPDVMDAQLFRIAAGDPLTSFVSYVGFAASGEAQGTFTLAAPSLSPQARRVVSRGVWLPAPVADPERWMLAGELIEADVLGARTGFGDSGAPLYAGSSQRKLIGMHIGSIPTPTGCKSICVPAWRLLDPRNYDGAAPGARWRLL